MFSILSFPSFSLKYGLNMVDEVAKIVISDLGESGS